MLFLASNGSRRNEEDFFGLKIMSYRNRPLKDIKDASLMAFILLFIYRFNKVY